MELPAIVRCHRWGTTEASGLLRTYAKEETERCHVLTVTVVVIIVVIVELSVVIELVVVVVLIVVAAVVVIAAAIMAISMDRVARTWLDIWKLVKTSSEKVDVAMSTLKFHSVTQLLLSQNTGSFQVYFSSVRCFSNRCQCQDFYFCIFNRIDWRWSWL